VNDPGNFFQVNDLKEFLRGVWWLRRQLHDHAAGQPGQLVGSAVFSPSGADLHYSEKGRLVIGDHANPVYEGPALQSYRYAFPEPGRAAVHFRDGRFFHDLDLTAGRWTATHLCDPDRYDGEFTVLDADRWRVVWRVTGPRKDLTLDSSYRRGL
jgi:hypothetical protein